MKETSKSRRGFLRNSTHASMLGAAASMGLFEAAHAATVEDYKALVCVYFYGGNDGNNMIVPLDPAHYNAYRTIRGGLALSQPTTLLPERTATLQAVDQPLSQPFAFHYGMPEIDQMFGQGKVAAVLNVGSMGKQLDKTEYIARRGVPPQLFSHPDQTLQNQNGHPSGGGTGWGGRLLDHFKANGALDSISLGPGGLFIEGKDVHGNQLPSSGQLSLNGKSDGGVREAALRAILSSTHNNLLSHAANKSLLEGIELADKLAAASSVAPIPVTFPADELGKQLKTVAQLIRLRQSQGPGRQVFFVSLGGFDTHSGQEFQQYDLLKRFSQSMAAFQSAMALLELEQKVTTFTMSDFGRTLVPNGNGTDHGWGNHQLVIGGAVNGGLYGRFPSFQLNGPDDATNRGSWIPQFSNQQFGASMGRWFGVSLDDLNKDVFKEELYKFNRPDLGFMA